MSKSKLKIWFIDDDGRLRDDIKECFDISTEYGEFEDNIYIKVLNSGTDGKNAYNTLVRFKNDAETRPDLIFCDLRFSDEKIEDISIHELGGVQLMKKISDIPEYSDTLILTFTEMPLSGTDRTNIQKILKHGKRVDSFIDKVDIGFKSVQLNEIDNIKISKSCDTLKALIKRIESKLR